MQGKELDRTIPVTLLGDWITEEAQKLGESKLTDSVAALKFIPDKSDSILTEKAVASIAIRNNKTSLWDAHGFSNSMLIMNANAASADYIAAVDPTYINYGIWELTKEDPGLVGGPDTTRFIIASLETYDYPYPPDELDILGDYFIDKYGDNAKYVGEYYKKIREVIFKNNAVADGIDLDKLMNETIKMKTEDMSSFVQYHVTRLLAIDDYTNKMILLYNMWAGKIKR